MFIEDYKKHKNVINKVIKGIIVILLFHFSYLLQYIPVILLKLNLKYINGTLSVILSCFSSVIFSVILFIIYRKDLKKEFKKFISNFDENINTGFSCWFVGLLCMFASNLVLNFVFKAGGAQNEQTVQSMISYLPYLMLIEAGIFAPFNEEIVFRKTLKDIFKNKWLFMLFSFLLFGGAHVIGSATTLVDWLYIIPYGSLGAAFAYAYYKTDTVFTSMFMHFFHNTVLVIMSIVLLII